MGLITKEDLENKLPMSVYVPQSMQDELDDLAERIGLSRSYIVRKVLRKFLDEGDFTWVFPTFL